MLVSKLILCLKLHILQLPQLELIPSIIEHLHTDVDLRAHLNQPTTSDDDFANVTHPEDSTGGLLLLNTSVCHIQGSVTDVLRMGSQQSIHPIQVHGSDMLLVHTCDDLAAALDNRVVGQVLHVYVTRELWRVKSDGAH